MAESLSEGLAAVGAIAVLAMVLLVTYSSISRDVFGRAVSYMEEVAGLLLMVVSFCAFAYVFVKGGHIRVVLIQQLFSEKVRGYVELFTHLILLFYLIVFTKLSYDFVVVSYQLNCHTASSNLYEVPWMAVMPVSGFLFGVVVLISCIEPLWDIVMGKKKELEFEKTVHIEEETKTF
jgi:TRAP-type C4-dicarboxylate transport system permease small subunit